MNLQEKLLKNGPWGPGRRASWTGPQSKQGTGTQGSDQGSGPRRKASGGQGRAWGWCWSQTGSGRPPRGGVSGLSPEQDRRTGTERPPRAPGLGKFCVSLDEVTGPRTRSTVPARRSRRVRQNERLGSEGRATLAAFGTVPASPGLLISGLPEPSPTSHPQCSGNSLTKTL